MTKRSDLQQGSGLIVVISLMLLLLFTAVLAMKLIPAYLDNREIEGIFRKMVQDTTLQNATPDDIRAAYSKRAEVDGIDDISADDIEISRNEGHLSLSASYVLKIHLLGNLTLQAEFAPSSEK